MRRLILEDPFARSAICSRNLAIFAFFVAVIGIWLARKGLEPAAALAIVGAALAIAGFAILFAFVAMAVIWRTGFRGLGLALGGLLLSVLLLVYPAYLAVQARTVPMVSDVSTDLDDPPAFMTTEKAVTARGGSTPPPPRKDQRALQERLYPDLQSLSLDAEALDVEKSIHKIIKRKHWTVVDEILPVRFTTGHIDVVVKTAVMGFPADLTIRIKGIGARTQVDIRSVARAGWQEPGSNAARVSTLAAEIDEANGEN